MILTGPAIHQKVLAGEITLEPFVESQLNPNSYNYRLGNNIAKVDARVSLGEYDLESPLDTIPAAGYILYPGNVYLANTYEIIGSSRFVTSLIGRSSVGRLGLFVQLTADLGHLGAAHRWTLELTCVQPIKIYPFMIIGQVSFWRPEGNHTYYNGPYNQYSVPKGVLGRFLIGDSQ